MIENQHHSSHDPESNQVGADADPAVAGIHKQYDDGCGEDRQTEKNGSAGAGQQHTHEEQRTAQAVQPAAFFGASQLKGEGDHHSKQRAHVVVIAPAGVNGVPVNFVIHNGVGDDIDPENLKKKGKTYANARPGEVAAGRFLPFYAAGEQVIGNQHRRELQRSEEGIRPTLGKVIPAEGTCQQIGAAKGNDAGQQLPLCFEKGAPANFRIQRQTDDHRQNQKRYQNQDHDAAVLGIEYGIGIDAGVIFPGGGNVTADDNGHQREKILAEKANINSQGDETAVHRQLQTKQIGEHGQRADQHEMQLGYEKHVRVFHKGEFSQPGE